MGIEELQGEREKKLVEHITSRQARMEETRLRFENLWKEITEYLMPYFDLYIQEDSTLRGKKLGTKVYNGRPINAAQVYANGLQGYLVAQHMDWFKFRMEDYTIREVPDIVEWLQEVEKIYYGMFQASNFYSAINEFFRYGGAICTSTMFIEEDIKNGKFCFMTRHPYEIYIDVNRYNVVDVVHRKFTLSARLAKQEFGEANLTKDMLECLKPGNNQDTPFKFIHAVFPRDERKDWKKDAKNKKFASVYINTDSGIAMREGGYDIFPSVTWRPEKDINQIYGGGPAMNSFADILTLNLISKDVLQAAHMAIDPPLIADDELRGKIRFIPRGVTYRERPEQTVVPVYNPAQFPIGVDREEKIQEIIFKHFYVDFFLMMASADKPMTATEVAERQGEKAVMLGPAVTNLSDDCLNPIFDIILQKLVESNRLPPPPPALLRMGGQDAIKIDYLGPLAQAQKRLFTSQSVGRSLAALAPIAQASPQVLKRVNWDKLAVKQLEDNGFPADCIRSDEDLAKILKEEQEAAMQQAQFEKEIQVAGVADKLNQPMQPGSMIDQIQKQAVGATGGGQ